MKDQIIIMFMLCYGFVLLYFSHGMVDNTQGHYENVLWHVGNYYGVSLSSTSKEMRIL